MRNFRIFRNQRIGSNQTVFTDLRAVKYDGINANEAEISHSTTMNGRLMAYGDPLANS